MKFEVANLIDDQEDEEDLQNSIVKDKNSGEFGHFINSSELCH